MQSLQPEVSPGPGNFASLIPNAPNIPSISPTTDKSLTTPTQFFAPATIESLNNDAMQTIMPAPITPDVRASRSSRTSTKQVTMSAEKKSSSFAESLEETIAAVLAERPDESKSNKAGMSATQSARPMVSAGTAGGSVGSNEQMGGAAVSAPSVSGQTLATPAQQQPLPRVPYVASASGTMLKICISHAPLSPTTAGNTVLLNSPTTSCAESMRIFLSSYIFFFSIHPTLQTSPSFSIPKGPTF